MIGNVLDDVMELGFGLNAIWMLVLAAFQIWMFVHAIRQREWIWAVFIFFGFTFSTLLYYFLVYRESQSATRGFELPGANDRRRVRQLQAQIHHLDNAYHHLQLGDIYFQQGKLAKAETSYRKAMERDPQDIDTRAHLGQCLLRQKRPAEARPLLESVCTENPKHDYGYTLMAYAETLTALNEVDAAMRVWQSVTSNHSYPRAKVQLAALYIDRQQYEPASTELRDVLDDDPHAPAFQRKRDRVWVRRAKKLLKRIPSL